MIDNVVGGFLTQLIHQKQNAFNKLKGGNIMETKSRYEVIAELEEKKRSLIICKDGLGDELRVMERSLRDQLRRVEDQKEEIKNFQEKMDDQKLTYEELIKSVDDSLKRLAELNKKS